MFDIIKDYNAILVTIDQILTTKGADFYMKICVDVEVAKNQKDSDVEDINWEFESITDPKVDQEVIDQLNDKLSIDQLMKALNKSTV